MKSNSTMEKNTAMFKYWGPEMYAIFKAPQAFLVCRQASERSQGSTASEGDHQDSSQLTADGVHLQRFFQLATRNVIAHSGMAKLRVSRAWCRLWADWERAVVNQPCPP